MLILPSGTSPWNWVLRAFLHLTQPLSHVAPVPFLEVGKLNPGPQREVQAPSRFLQPTGPSAPQSRGSSHPQDSVSVPVRVFL